MSNLPAFSRFRSAREGLISAAGKLPQGWSNENFDEIEVEAIDLGPNGRAVTLRVSFAAANPSPFLSLVLGDYLPVDPDDVIALRLEAEFSRAQNVDAGFAIIREWIAGGDYVDQTTRPIPLDRGAVPVVAARAAGVHSRVFQPVLSIRHTPGTAGQVTIRVRRLAFASLHAYPGWLSDGGD